MTGHGSVVADLGDEVDCLVEGLVDGRPMRADARRNYERLVAAAKVVFGRCGGDVPMEAVAKEAGVGVGTLYRHFPKRIDLVEAVYKTDVDQLVGATEGAATAGATVEATADLEPWPALVNWLESFVRYAQSKRNFLNELHQAFEKNPQLKVSSRERIEAAAEAVLERAQRAGVARTDIDGADLMQLIGPMCMAATLTEEQSERLLACVIDGLRVPGQSAHDAQSR